MQIKHTWTEVEEQGLLSSKFLYQLSMRCALTQEELDLVKKYKVKKAWLYSNREARDSQKQKPSYSADFLTQFAAGWNNAGIEKLLEISFSDLLSGAVVKNENPWFLQDIFEAVSKKAKNILTELAEIDALFCGKELVLEVDTSVDG